MFTTAFHKYNERVRPYNNGLHPVEIKANLEFIDIVSIDTKHGQLESIVDLRVVSGYFSLYLLLMYISQSANLGRFRGPKC